jgi:hypothetical protein
MRQWLITSVAAMAVVGTGICRAGDLNIGVILSGQIAPGVYGQVQLGNNPPPPLVSAQPVVIEPVPYVVTPTPVYLHVPPEHARNWREHCREYNACSRPVYFVRSAEYEPGYARRDSGHGHDHDRGHEHHDNRDHDRHGEN